MYGDPPISAILNSSKQRSFVKIKQMATTHDLHLALQAYSGIKEVERSTSFRSATFKANGKGIIAIEKDGSHATFALAEHDARAILERPDFLAEGIYKGERLIGVRVMLAELTIQQVNGLVRLAWDKAANK